MRRKMLILGLLALVLVLPACGEDPAQVDPDVTILTYAILDPENTNLEAINAFNRTHKHVKIQPKNYTRLSENGKQGADLLSVELATGKVPDIIDLGSDGQLCQLSYRALAEKGYLEDLWPYIENDPDLGRKGVMEAFLRPAEVDGGLYTIYNAVKVCTLLGAEPVVGERTSWTLEEMRAAFDSMPEGELLLDDIVNGGTVPSMQRYLLTSMTGGFIDQFVDQESKQCFFDGQLFRDLLEFIGTIPDTPEDYEWRSECDPKDPEDLFAQHIRRVRSGRVMLRSVKLQNMAMLRLNRAYFGQRPVPAGYPMGEGVIGSYYEPCNSKLCMSSTCEDKEAAWEFIRQIFQFSTQHDVFRLEGIPVSKKMYNIGLRDWYSQITGTNIGGSHIDLENATKEELDQVEAYFGSITRCSLFLEPAVLEMIEEEAAAYFAGAASLDQTVERIQSRATLYVNESR